MRIRTFLIKTVNLALIFTVLLLYQNRARARAAETEAYEARAQEAEQAWALAKEQESESPETEARYADGSYQGSGTGFGGEILVQADIQDGRIVSVSVLSAEKETPEYLEMASALTDEVVAAQSTEIDTVSGATFSSRGILEAAADALAQAETGN